MWLCSNAQGTTSTVVPGKSVCVRMYQEKLTQNCVYVRMYLCMYVRIVRTVCMLIARSVHMCTYVCIHMHMYACVCVCECVFVCVSGLFEVGHLLICLFIVFIQKYVFISSPVHS